MQTIGKTEAVHATLAGTLPFPEILAKLIVAGVEFYQLDYAGLTKWHAKSNGGCSNTPIRSRCSRQPSV